MASISDIDVYERPALAIARLAEKDISGAGRTLFAPTTLSPSQRKSLLSEFIGEEHVDSPYGKALSVVTNPFVLAGIVLSMRFPIPTMKNLMKVSKRLGGYERYVNPVAKFLGDANETFRGTSVPNLLGGLSRAIHGYRERYLGDLSDVGLSGLLRKYSARAGSDITPSSAYRISAYLDGLDTAGPIAKQLGLPYLVKRPRLSPAEKWLADSLQSKWFKGQYADSLKLGGKELRQHLRRGGLAAEGDEIKKLERYWPHIAQKTSSELNEQMMELLSRQAYGERAVRAAKKVTTVHAADRHFGMLPEPADLRLMEKLMPGTLHPEALPKLEAEITRRARKFAANPDKYSPPKTYTLNMVPTLERYTNSLARAYGWTVHPEKYGKKLVGEYNKAVAAGPNGIVKAEMLKNTYFPWALGQQTFVQGVKAAEWAGTKKWAVDTLNHPAITKFVPKSVKSKIEDMIMTGHTLKSPGTAGAGIAGWFYISALGLNPASAALNLTQTLLTTAPAIGTKWTYRGMEETIKKGSRYFSLRSRGVEADAALAKAFPEFHEAGLTRSELLDKGLSGILDDSWRRGVAATSGARTTESVKKAMMALFSTTERFNRFSAFEGARLKALSEGVRGQEVLDLASDFMERTQFVPGLRGTPYGFINLPPWIRQFGTFPTKWAAHLLKAGTTWGGAEQAIGDGVPLLAGRNLGVLGRTALISGLAHGTAKEFLGTDMSHALMFGALPSPRPDSPLGVVPFTPPAVTLPAAALKSLIDEDFTPLAQELPLLMPGGVAASRTFSLLGGRLGAPQVAVKGVSELVDREYVDYTRPNEQGRYPIYSGKGKLKGFVSGNELVAKAAGIPAGDLQREGEYLHYLNVQKQQIQGYKRSWIEAYLTNDVAKQEAINQEFKQQYQIEIPIKKSDIRAAESTRDVTRLERMLGTFPRELRPQFQAILGTAFGSNAESFLGSSF